jgi:ribonuclease HI
MKHVEIYTDGACIANPTGAGGWAAVLRCGTATKEISGHIPAPTTNNRAEWAAIIRALEALREPCTVKIYTDSKVCVFGLSGKGKPAHKRANYDLLSRVLELAKVHKVSLQWVRGHHGDASNERCDQLATEAARFGADIDTRFCLQPEQQSSFVSV